MSSFFVHFSRFCKAKCPFIANCGLIQAEISRFLEIIEIFGGGRQTKDLSRGTRRHGVPQSWCSTLFPSLCNSVNSVCPVRGLPIIPALCEVFGEIIHTIDRLPFLSDNSNMSNRRLRGKDYVGCLIQIITIIAGIFAIIQGIAWLIEVSK